MFLVGRYVPNSSPWSPNGSAHLTPWLFVTCLLLLVISNAQAAVIKREYQEIYYGSGLESSTHTIVMDGLDRREEWTGANHRVILERAGNNYFYQLSPNERTYTRRTKLSDKDLNPNTPLSPSQYNIHDLQPLRTTHVVAEGPVGPVVVNGYLCYTYTTREATELLTSKATNAQRYNLVQILWKTEATGDMRSFEKAESEFYRAYRQATELSPVRSILGEWVEATSAGMSPKEFTPPPVWVKQNFPNWRRASFVRFTLTEVRQIGPTSSSPDEFTIPTEYQLRP
jgi:hypothetical protein